MEKIHPAVFLLVTCNVILSYLAFRDKNLFNQLKFHVKSVRFHHQYYRIITSAFLHASWMHLLFNMISLILFSNLVIVSAGIFAYLLIYFISLTGGDLLSLFIHRNHPDYSSIGASGAVNGIIFASIAINPGLKLSLILFPVFIPAWLFGLLFVLISIYGIKSTRDEIGHDAHLGGAVTGILVAVLLIPEIVIYNYLTVLIIVLPALFFIYLIISRPHLLIINFNFNKSYKNYFSIDEKYNIEKTEQQNELDRILDKINKTGIKSLTEKEKSFLDKRSGK
jgi:membrane associated rhomboid family serine protease